MAGQGGRRAGAARERLLAAALTLFARQGVSGTSLHNASPRSILRSATSAPHRSRLRAIK